MTIHSVTLVSGNPTTLIEALRIAGSPTPNATVRKTENESRSADLRAECGAILEECSVYFRSCARITVRGGGGGGGSLHASCCKAPQTRTATLRSRCTSHDAHVKKTQTNKPPKPQHTYGFIVCALEFNIPNLSLLHSVEVSWPLVQAANNMLVHKRVAF